MESGGSTEAQFPFLQAQCLGKERLPSSFLLRMEVIVVVVKGVEKGLIGDGEGTSVFSESHPWVQITP